MTTSWPVYQELIQIHSYIRLSLIQRNEIKLFGTINTQIAVLAYNYNHNNTA